MSLVKNSKFSNPYFFTTWYLNFWSNKIHGSKYLRSTTLGCKDKGIRKSDFVGKTQLLKVFRNKDHLFLTPWPLIYLKNSPMRYFSPMHVDFRTIVFISSFRSNWHYSHRFMRKSMGIFGSPPLSSHLSSHLFWWISFLCYIRVFTLLRNFSHDKK